MRELTPEEQREQTTAACKRIEKEMQSPEFQRAVIWDAEKCQHGQPRGNQCAECELIAAGFWPAN